MLILHRWIDEGILIRVGDREVKIKVLSIHGLSSKGPLSKSQRVLIGIDAPKDILVIREELISNESQGDSSCNTKQD